MTMSGSGGGEVGGEAANFSPLLPLHARSFRPEGEISVSLPASNKKR